MSKDEMCVLACLTLAILALLAGEPDEVATFVAAGLVIVAVAQ